LGNWLSLEQCSKILNGVTGGDLRAKRDHATISMLVGCGLRPAEKRLGEEELDGLREDKLKSIRWFAKFLEESAALTVTVRISASAGSVARP